MVDVPTIIGIRRTVKDAAAALAAEPGRPDKERDWILEKSTVRSSCIHASLSLAAALRAPGYVVPGVLGRTVHPGFEVQVRASGITR